MKISFAQYVVPEGFYLLRCDCDCSTKCPNGKIGSQEKCLILRSKNMTQHDRAIKSIEERTNKLIKDPEALKKYLEELKKHIDDDGDSDKI